MSYAITRMEDEIRVLNLSIEKCQQCLSRLQREMHDLEDKKSRISDIYRGNINGDIREMHVNDIFEGNLSEAIAREMNDVESDVMRNISIIEVIMNDITSQMSKIGYSVSNYNSKISSLRNKIRIERQKEEAKRRN